MSKNIIHTIGQHVFKYLPPEFTEEGAPFLAKNPERKISVTDKSDRITEKLQFLGEGYYFWDDNIERAHKWGKDHYKGHYLIMEIPLILKGPSFLDLVGSREDLGIFVGALKEILRDIGAYPFFRGRLSVLRA